MSTKDAPTTSPDRNRDFSATAPRGGAWRGQPLWAKLLLVASVFLMAAGVALPLALSPHEPAMSDEAAEQPRATADDPSRLASGLAPGAPGEASAALAEGDVGEPAIEDQLPWPPTLFRLGFSFFVGFAIAYAVRSFVKFSVVAAGIVLLLLFGLQYAGIIEVRWTMMEGHYDSFMGWLRTQTESFGAFVTGYLPSTATAMAGLVVGFRRR